MNRFKQLVLLLTTTSIQVCSVLCQWNDLNSGAAVYYVPTPGSSFNGPNPNLGPVQYYSQSGPYQPSNIPPGFSNAPYQGLDEAYALRAAYPNQPIIIINNGGNGDTGGNSNNGNGDKRDGFNFGDLAAILLATNRKGKRFNGPDDGDAGPPSSPPPPLPPQYSPPPQYTPPPQYPTLTQCPPPSQYQTQNIQPFTPDNSISQCNNGRNNKNGSKGTITNITIILPSTGGTVSVEEKKEKKKKQDISEESHDE